MQQGVDNDTVDQWRSLHTCTEALGVFQNTHSDSHISQNFVNVG